MAKYKIGVCQSSAEMTTDSDAWTKLCATVAREAPHLFLLNEMPFGAWIAAGDTFDETAWSESCSAHDDGVARLSDIGARVVASSRPIRSTDRRMNEAFLWSRDRRLQPVHTKQYFPDEEGYYEARWFQPGERHFRTAPADGLSCGFLICTELMFNERARQYGRAGAQVILVPRATGGGSLDRWLVAMRMAAIVSGCYVISSNRGGASARGQVFGGTGWIIDPSGDLIAQTSETSPVAFHEIDTALVKQAQADYPCYVKE